VGLAGCGAIASHFHLPLLAASSSSTLVAVAESDERRHGQIRTLAPQARIFNTWQALIEAGGLDALVVCLPPALHAPCGLAALSNNLALYMEKPLASTLEEAISLEQAARVSSRPSMIGFNFRFHPGIVSLRHDMQAARAGKLIALRFLFTVPGGNLPDWKRSISSGGGALLDLAIHHVDLIHFLLDDEVAEVRQLQLARDGDCQSAMLQLRMLSGVLVDGLFSLATTDQFRIDVYGDAGHLAFDRQLHPQAAFYPRHHLWTRAEKIRAALLQLLPGNLLRGPGYEPSFATALQAFLTAAASNTPIHPNFTDALKAHQVLAKATT
jgi:myo-inositol 2-dehydrogenase/D-chiro-inositol 1-dehydrogenase